MGGAVSLKQWTVLAGDLPGTGVPPESVMLIDSTVEELFSGETETASILP